MYFKEGVYSENACTYSGRDVLFNPNRLGSYDSDGNIDLCRSRETRFLRDTPSDHNAWGHHPNRTTRRDCRAQVTPNPSIKVTILGNEHSSTPQRFPNRRRFFYIY